MLEVVIDTNVLVSAITGGRTTKGVYEDLRKGKFTIVLSEPLLGELLEVFSRPEFETEHSDFEDFIAFIHTYSKIIKADQKVNICRDPEDNMIIECAIAGKVKYIVTGDKDLLALKSTHGISIITPRTFIKLLHSNI